MAGNHPRQALGSGKAGWPLEKATGRDLAGCPAAGWARPPRWAKPALRRSGLANGGAKCIGLPMDVCSLLALAFVSWYPWVCV